MSPLLQYQTKTDIAAKFWPGLAWWAAVLAWFGAAGQPQKRAKATFPPQRADQALMGYITGTQAVTVSSKQISLVLVLLLAEQELLLVGAVAAVVGGAVAVAGGAVAAPDRVELTVGRAEERAGERHGGRTGERRVECRAERVAG